MAVYFCVDCDKQIDLDYNVEHFVKCPDVTYIEVRGENEEDWEFVFVDHGDKKVMAVF